MPGRYEFSLPERPMRDGWFRAGTFDVTTTALLVGLGVASMFLYAIDKVTAMKGSYLSPLVLEGELWRLVTWPLINPPTDIWVVITFAFFWFMGHQIEDRVGRVPFTWLIVAMTVLPAVLVTLFDIDGDVAGAAGLGLLAIGLLVVFAVDNPGALFMFGIPAWALAGVFVLIDVLRLTADRLMAQLLLEILIIVVGCVGARQLGLLDNVTFIPRLAAFSNRSSSPYGEIGSARPKSKGRRPKGGRKPSGPTVVAGPWGADSGPSRLEQAELDVLLDKISEGGIDSLNAMERKRLNELSKKMRGS